MIVVVMCWANTSHNAEAFIYESLDQPTIYIQIEMKTPANKMEQTTPETTYRTIAVPSHADNSFKTYMDYRAITDHTSQQWKLQEKAYTDDKGLRKVGDYYCVALGSAFSSEIGAKFEITLEDGQTFKAILADQKADRHTDTTNKYRQLDNGKINVVEFIVDTNKLENLPKVMGDVSHVSDGEFAGEIIEIREIIE